jgi:hypothetical protein
MKWLVICLGLFMVLGCANTNITYWDPVTGNKEAKYSNFAVFRNDISITDMTSKTKGLKIGINRPGLSDNGLEALRIAPDLANEIGNTIQGTQALDALEKGAKAKLKADVLNETLRSGAPLSSVD